MHVLVTGGAGFIGSHVVLELLKQGHTVVVIDCMNEYYDPALKRARLKRFADKIDFYEIDIADTNAVEEVFKKHQFDAVCHLAAQAGVRYSLVNPFIYAHSNYVGTLNIFEFAKRTKVPHVVFASTSSVYGKNTKMPFREDDSVSTPMSIYSASKLATEHLAFSYHDMFGMNLSALRFFNVYGPWGRPDSAIWLFTKAILAGEAIKVFNHGNMERDFTYIDDIVDGIVSALQKPDGFQIYNLGKGAPVQLMEYVRTIERILGKEAKIDMLPMQPGDVANTYANIEKAESKLGYNPKTAVPEGVQKFIEWYISYHA